MATSRKYLGKNCDLERLADSVVEYFQTRNYATQNGQKDAGWVVQARKEGTLRSVVAADRSFTVTVAGEPNSFSVTFGIGRWLQNLSVAALEGIVIGPAIFLAEVPVSM